jgi:hypothetical protein
MQKHHSAQRYGLLQKLAWFNIWRRYGRQLETSNNSKRFQQQMAHWNGKGMSSLRYSATPTRPPRGPLASLCFVALPERTHHCAASLPQTFRKKRTRQQSPARERQKRKGRKGQGTPLLHDCLQQSTVLPQQPSGRICQSTYVSEQPANQVIRHLRAMKNAKSRLSAAHGRTLSLSCSTKSSTASVSTVSPSAS